MVAALTKTAKICTKKSNCFSSESTVPRFNLNGAVPMTL